MPRDYVNSFRAGTILFKVVRTISLKLQVAYTYLEQWRWCYCCQLWRWCHCCELPIASRVCWREVRSHVISRPSARISGPDRVLFNWPRRRCSYRPGCRSGNVVWRVNVFWQFGKEEKEPWSLQTTTTLQQLLDPSVDRLKWSLGYSIGFHNR